MTNLEQRALEAVPSIGQELKNLNDNLSRLINHLENDVATSVSACALKDSSPISHNQIYNSDGAATLLKRDLNRLDHEEVWILLLNHDMRPMKKERINIGTLSQSLIDVRRIVKTAIINAASSIILFHNHPSSNPLPSEEDIKRTEELRDSLKLFSIDLTDHIIIGGNGETYFSFANDKVHSLKKKL